MLSLLIVQPMCVSKAQLVYEQRTLRTFSPVCFLSAHAVLNYVDLHQVVLSSLICESVVTAGCCLGSGCAHPLLISHFKHAETLTAHYVNFCAVPFSYHSSTYQRNSLPHRPCLHLVVTSISSNWNHKWSAICGVLKTHFDRITQAAFRAVHFVLCV